MIYLSAVGVWFVFLLIAFGVGAVREGILRPRIGEPKAHVIGTLIAVTFMMLVIYAFIRRLHDSRSMTDLILIGVLWLSMTVAFEFGFFHYVMGKIEQPRMNYMTDICVSMGVKTRERECIWDCSDG